jgi:mRNA interferase MazF
MISAGDILAFRFPQSNLIEGKLRPALVIKEIKGNFDDWLVCMISTQIRHKVEGLEIIISESVKGFSHTGLKKESLIRTSRLAVVHSDIFEGKLGYLPNETFETVRNLLSEWIRK